ncbi:TMAO reductase system periplasmic protein TorT [Photobacterium jeanii]|nr:TMAO reductase system periplasmic protein TorT [Photobacterium jeanii]
MQKLPLLYLFFLAIPALFGAESVQARQVFSHTPPFSPDPHAKSIKYPLLETASKAWKVCAVYPHLKDSYWLSINYGMVQQAKKLGIELKVFEAGGYPHLEKQESQLAECRSWGADAIILGTVDRTAYNGKLSQLTGDIPVFAMTNDIDFSDPDIKKNIKARVGVNWYWMGKATGDFLAKRHPKGSGKVKVAWLPGPQLRGGTKPVSTGFNDAVKDSDVEVVTTLWADNSKELQRDLIQQLLIKHPDINYIIGGAVAAEVAISELRSINKNDQIKILSTYLSHGVYRGLRRGKIMFSPTDKMAQQAKLSVDQAVRYLEGKATQTDLSPMIEALTPQHLPEDTITESLSPAEFRPVFRVADHQIIR